ncbi:hypothetical protein A2706_00085 [Candidatus Peribacteria bacterium RIFCSPHIGHO2_01_FULL_51_35]|nr:MAG: hypothetical protein A2706_00085 [Candidatus Peribacteria bacterium RIFCSPHIGHO2_01_FULL_51_35]
MWKSLFCFLILIGMLSTVPAHAVWMALDGFQDQSTSVPSAVSSSSTAASVTSTGFAGSASSRKTVIPVFTDIPGDAWFAHYVDFMIEWKIVEGYKEPDGTPKNLFGPADPVTVAQFLKMALRAAKKDEKTCLTEIVDEDMRSHWASAFVACALDGRFRLFSDETLPDPDRPLLRGETLGMLHDVFEDRSSEFFSPFTDTEGHAYESDIAYANFRGIISGDADARRDPLWTFRPDDGLNRAEAAKIIYEQVRSLLLALESGEAVTIDVSSKNHAFVPKTIRVKKGQLVTLRFKNTGVHTFTVPSLLINKLLLESKEEVSFVAEKIGTYPFQCAVQGHKEKGMEGVIVIGE